MINIDLFYFINNGLKNPLFDFIMPFTTELGSFVAMLGICLIVIILSILFKKPSIKKIALLCLFSLLLADGIALLLKCIIMEPRPFVYLDNVRLLVVENDPCSFPSGHTTSTFAVLSVLVFKFRHRLWSVVLILFGVVIGFSRIYVGVHYPLDVLAGCIIGVLSAYFTYRYEDKICSFFNGVVGVVKRS
ncbi:MAG: phosphatase PAP2 family protein [Methanobrevibacter sp.]|nr:phosphatase PAP2 family protein [Methanobrevibacter sp.]